MTKVLVILSLVITLAGCGILTPQQEEILVGCGSVTYESIIGQTWYSNQSLAPLFAEATLFFTYSVEKWMFYRDSIVVIATHYDRNTMQALDQFKFIANVGRMDEIWTEETLGEVWQTTNTVWESQARSIGGCGWSDIYSFTSPPVNIIVEKNPEKEGCIAIGSYELMKYHPLVKEPLDLWFIDNWVGFVCGDV